MTVPFWHPSRHKERRQRLMARNRIQMAIRQWFYQEGFVETDPSIMQVSPGNELHLHAFSSELSDVSGALLKRLYLHTSPEFAMKKLIAAGETKIFTFSHCFRNRETGPLHSPEFVLLEWYRTDEPFDQIKSDCQEILKIAARAASQDFLAFGKTSTDPFGPARSLSIQEAFLAHAGLDILSTIGPDGTGNAALLRSKASHLMRIEAEYSWSDIFSMLLTGFVEPALETSTPLFLEDYPAPEAALAKRNPDNAKTALRFELYAAGVELANAFEELTDPKEQRHRFEKDMREKHQLYGEAYPIDEELLEALSFMPPTAGIALGFDRLVMLATHAGDIHEVLWAPVNLLF